jgi:predicted transcriptional regulator
MGQQNFMNTKTDGGEWQSHRAISSLSVDLVMNSLNKKVSVLCKDSVRTAQWTHYVLVLKTIRLMMYKAKDAVCSEIHTEHINTLWEEGRIFLVLNLVIRKVNTRL